MKNCPPFFLAFLVFAVLFACTSDSSGDKNDTAKSRIIVDDIVDTARVAPLPTLQGIIVDDIVDTARVWRVNSGEGTSVIIPKPNFWLIGPTNKIVSGQMALSATGMSTPNKAGDSWQVGSQTLTAGATGDYIPVQVISGGTTFTMLLEKTAFAAAVNRVR